MVIHASYYQPRVYPYNGDITPVQVDRLQELSSAATLNRTKIEEVGRVGTVGFSKGIPSITLTARQLEYGTLEFWRKLSNVSDATNTVNLTDFETSAFDIAGYETDVNGTFLGTVWYPAYRMASFSFNIGDPSALMERNFSFVGEDKAVLQNDNKYFIYKRFVASGGTPETFNVTNPSPTEDPDNSGQYILRVLKVSGTTTTELTYNAATPSATEYTFNSGTGDLDTDTLAADVIKVYYSASSYISGDTPFTDNDADASGLQAEDSTILLATANTLSRLQSVAVEVTFDRDDIREIGSPDVVSRSVRDTTVRVTLGRILETYTIEEVLRGVAGLSYGKIDVRKFLDTNKLIIKTYSDNTKASFLLGYSFDAMAVTNVDTGTPVSENVTQGTVLEGETGLITVTEGSL